MHCTNVSTGNKYIKFFDLIYYFYLVCMFNCFNFGFFSIFIDIVNHQSPTFLFGRKEKDGKTTEESKLSKKDKEAKDKEDEKNKKDKKEKKDKKGSKDEDKEKAKEDKVKLKEEKERNKREKKEQELLAKESKSKKDKDNKDKKDKDKKDKKDKSDKVKDSKKDKKSKKSEDGKKVTGQDSLISDKDRSLTQESSFDTSSVPSSPERVDVSQLSAEGSPLPGYTKPYNYLDESSDPKNKGKVLVGAFSYENKDKVESPKDDHETSSGRHAVGIAFNYAPGEAQKVAETAAEKRKTLLEKSGNESDVIPVGLRTPGLDYVESAVRKEQAKTGSDLSPGARRALDMKGGGIFHAGKDNKSSFEDTNKALKTPAESTINANKISSTQEDPKAGVTTIKDNKGMPVSGNLAQYDEGLKGGTYPYGAAGDSPHLLQDINKEFLKAERGDVDQPQGKIGTPAGAGGPKIVKTTTKQSVVKDREGVTQNIEEKVEDMQSGEVTVSTQVNKVSH